MATFDSMGNLDSMSSLDSMGALQGGGGSPFNPALAMGFVTSAQVLFGYAVEPGDPLAKGGLTASHHVVAGPEQNLRSWAGWVRASIFLSDFMRDFDWVADHDESGLEGSIALSYRNRNSAGVEAAAPFYLLTRPPMSAFAAQLDKMRNYMDQRSERATEIITQVDQMPEYLGTILGLTAKRNRWTLELMGITLAAASHAGMVAKNHMACRRPGQIGATVLPMLPTPEHGSFPSGHATEAFAIATVLAGLVKSENGSRFFAAGDRLVAMLHKQAERIATNRVVAGLHYPIDSWAGASLGVAIGQIVLAKCGERSSAVDRFSYVAQGESDFLLGDFLDGARAGQHGLTIHESAVPVSGSSVFEWLWSQVQSEFSLG